MHCHKKVGRHGHKVVCDTICTNTNRTVSGLAKKSGQLEPFLFAKFVPGQKWSMNTILKYKKNVRQHIYTYFKKFIGLPILNTEAILYHGDTTHVQ